jgi:hypothetical protein
MFQRLQGRKVCRLRLAKERGHGVRGLWEWSAGSVSDYFLSGFSILPPGSLARWAPAF